MYMLANTPSCAGIKILYDLWLYILATGCKQYRSNYYGTETYLSRTYILPMRYI